MRHGAQHGGQGGVRACCVPALARRAWGAGQATGAGRGAAAVGGAAGTGLRRRVECGRSTAGQRQGLPMPCKLANNGRGAGGRGAGVPGGRCAGHRQGPQGAAGAEHGRGRGRCPAGGAQGGRGPQVAGPHWAPVGGGAGGASINVRFGLFGLGWIAPAQTENPTPIAFLDREQT